MIILYKLKRGQRRRNVNIIRNRGKVVGAMYEAGGIGSILRKSEICLPLRLGEKVT